MVQFFYSKEYRKFKNRPGVFEVRLSIDGVSPEDNITTTGTVALWCEDDQETYSWRGTTKCSPTYEDAMDLVAKITKDHKNYDLTWIESIELDEKANNFKFPEYRIKLGS